ncbi:MAG: PQQ-dependent sugar dehydrogenase [Myxococcales bacterium]|nr:PQQ-dependent sugar dehydrogenase [Myxococcales bacterium]
MLTARWVLPAMLIALSLSCNGNKDDTDTDTTTDAQPTGDTGEPVDSEFGLDSRPANPTCIAGARPIVGSQAALVRQFPNLGFSFGNVALQAPGDTDHWYVATLGGEIHRFDATDPDVDATELVADVPVRTGFERGLLSMAFHPDFQSNGYLYLYASRGQAGGNVDHVARISRLESTDGGASFDLKTETTILEFDQPAGNHNGGTLLFDNDGYLLLSNGDGGGNANTSQNTNNLLGNVLRIDVDGGDPYAIPSDNPFATGGGAPEIYAWGLRNPYRMSIDRPTGELYVGDVGEVSFEEISKIELGGNYGWPLMEGFDCRVSDEECEEAGLTLPELDYGRQGGGASVMVGDVYRGSLVPALQGVLLYNDYYRNEIRGMFADAQTGEIDSRAVVQSSGITAVHYHTGHDGELYVLDQGGNGGLYRFEPAPNAPIDTFPTLLSETGCMDPSDVTMPGPGLIPYDVAHTFWADDGDKQRWMALPDGQTVTIDADGDWLFPVGTVLVKQFRRDGELLETRLMMHHDDGWGGYSYVYDDAGTEAVFSRAGELIDVGSSPWEIPTPADCLACHTDAANHALGLESRQLAIDITYPSTNRRAPQLDTLAHIGVVADPGAPEAFPARDGTASAEELARTYLHVNCSSCHRPGVAGRAELDLRVSTGLAETGLCDAPVLGGLGNDKALVITPGDPAASVLVDRMSRRDAHGMPPIATHRVDDDGVALVEAWISSLSSCP